MKITAFDPTRDLIFVPEVIDELGYSPREHGEQIAVMRSAVGHEHGYIPRRALRLSWFSRD